MDNESTDDQPCQRSFSEGILGGQNTQEEAPVAQLDLSNYYERELQWKNNEIDLLKRQLENSVKLVKFYKNRIPTVDQPMNENTNAASIELDNAIQDVISGLISSNMRYCRYGNKQKGMLIAKAVFDQDFLNGCALPYLIAKSKAWLRQNVFIPWKTLKAMDLAGGSLNYKGLEVLREVESNGKKYYRGGVLPCTADLKRAALKIEA